MTLLIVRHAESVANIDHDLYQKIGDHQVPITDKGQQQALEAGHYLKEWYEKNPPKSDVRVWCSPYLRTTQTLLKMQEGMGDFAWDTCSRGHDVQFDERLREREWGYYAHDHYMQKQLEAQHHKEQELFLTSWHTSGGRYFTRPYGGENLADVSLRVRSFLNDLFRDVDQGKTDHIIVTHGMLMLTLVMTMTRAHPYHMNKAIVPDNTGIILMDRDVQSGLYEDFGAIYSPSQNIRLLQKPDQPITRSLKELNLI